MLLYNDHAPSPFPQPRVERLSQPGMESTATGLSVDLHALRLALRDEDPTVIETIERMATGESEGADIGEAGVDVAAVWSFFTTSVYSSGDLPVVASREALQNSVDAIRAAVRSRQIRAGEGSFEILWDEAAKTLTWDDNGIGMDKATLIDKFFRIGASGKRDEASSDMAAGGFGVAKAVILGVSGIGKWAMHTREWEATGWHREGGRSLRKIDRAPSGFRQGTRFTVFTPAQRIDRLGAMKEEAGRQYDYARQEYVDVDERLEELLGACDFGGEITLRYNGSVINPYFPRRRGTKLGEWSKAWGEGTSAIVKSYRRSAGDKQGAYYIRLNGLFQHKKAGEGLNMDIVVDLTTSVRPGETGYPLTVSRDSLQGRADETFYQMKRIVERENLSTGKLEEYEVFLPDDDNPAMREREEELGQQMSEAMSDKDLLAGLKGMLGGLDELYADLSKQYAKDRVEPVDSAAPAGSQEPIQDEGGGPSRKLPSGPRSSDANEVTKTGAIIGSDGSDPKGELKGFLEGARITIVTAEGGTSGWNVRAIDKAIQRIDAEDSLDLLSSWERQEVEEAIEIAQNAAYGTGGGGLIQAIGAVKAREVFDATAGEKVSRRPAVYNPFGKVAGFRVHRKNYDRARARRFVKNYARYVPMLLAWDTTLRLLAKEAGIARGFKPGFILDQNVRAMAANESDGSNVIYLYPDTVEAFVRVHKERPWTVAAYFHATACHELTHLDGRMGDGHNEKFVAAREDLGVSTSHLLPAIEVVVTKALRLKPPVSKDAKLTDRLKNRLAKAAETAAQGKYKGALDKVIAERDAHEKTSAHMLKAYNEERQQRIDLDMRLRSCHSTAERNTVLADAIRTAATAAFSHVDDAADRLYAEVHGFLCLNGYSEAASAMAAEGPRWRQDIRDRLVRMLLAAQGS